MKATPTPARTPLLRLLQQAFRLAAHSLEPGAPAPADLAAQAVAASRRRFLATTAKAGVAVAAGGLLAACTDEAEVAPARPGTRTTLGAQTSAPRIAIVGAGMAGLNCAYQLSKAGLGATVYEASPRAGGRIFTARNLMGPGVTTELGGEFIDSGHLDMRQLAAEFGLPLLDVQAPSETALIKDAYFFNGRQYQLSEIIAAFQPWARQMQEDIRSLPNTITYDNLTPAAARLDQLSISGYLESIGMTGLLRELLDVAYVTEYGRETHEQTAINLLWLFSADTHKGEFDIFGISDERYKIVGGNQQLTDALAAALPGQLRLQHRLLALDRTAAGLYQLTFRLADNTTTVVEADMVVLTLPFTLLREVDLRLPLPAWKTRAIRELGYGTNAKVFLGFNGRPWRHRGYTGYIFSDQLTQSGWDSTQLQPTPLGLYTAYLGGRLGEEAGRGTAATQAAAHLAVLEAAWPGCRAAYNGRAERFHWPTHPFTKASYACYRVGQYSTIAGAEIKPVDQLFFAGEHCSAWYQGYMNGAAETGRLAAESIAALVRTNKATSFLRHRLRRRAVAS